MILKVNSLTKKYGRFIAANNISFEVEEGQVFGILGPNGSGKTTTLGMILDVTSPDAGSYCWFDTTPGSNQRKHIGSILETPNFYQHLDAESNLKIAALIKDVPYSQIDVVLQRVNLLERKKYAFRTFSLGMKQRLALAAALLGNPKVLVLDEPTNGLDPQGIIEVRELIQSLANEGKTIIIASHLLDEIEKICTNVMVMKQGNVLAAGRVDEILSSQFGIHTSSKGAKDSQQQTNNNMEEIRIEIAADDLYLLELELERLPYVVKVEKRKETLMALLNKNIDNKSINQAMFDRGIVLSHLIKIKKTLEQQFLEITK